ncbi:MAG: transporter substrate-binding domain-containing protein [Undibacterium sp.]|nr:transporter substrate-binding domain-containing protein [Undibacterium sp.]
MLKVSLATALICHAFLPSIAQAESIKLVIQEFAPLTHTSAKANVVEGVLTEKIQEIMKRAGETTSIRSTSLARALLATQTEENTCMIGLRRTPERESSFNWIGPLITDDWVLYGKKDNLRKLKNFEEAKPYRIGSYKNAATGLQLTEQGYKIEFASEDEDNPRLLLNDRIDYWIVSELHGMYIAQQQGHGKDISHAVRYKNIELYMLCHNAMDRQRVAKFNKLNKEIETDGTMEKILHKYGVH